MSAFAGELYKTVRRPAVWVCVLVLLAIAVTIGYAIPWAFATLTPPSAVRGLPEGTTLADLKITLYPASFVSETLQQWGSLGGVFALIVGVLLQGSEYGWATMKTLFTQRDGRVVMLAGKLGALAVVVIVMVVALFITDAVCSVGVALIDGKTISFPAAGEIAKGVGAMYLIFGFWATFGVVLATAFRQSAMAIGLGLAYALVIEGIIFGVAGSFAPDNVNPIRQWFPVTNAGYLADSFGRTAIRGINLPAPYAGATHAVVVLAVYVAVCVAITALLVRRRDVTA